MMDISMNTPGYYYAVAYWVVVMSYISVYKRPGRKAVLALDGAALAVLVIWMRITHDAAGWRYLLSMGVVFAFVMVYFRYRCRLQPDETVFYGVKAFLTGELGASLAWQIYVQYYQAFPQNSQLAFQILLMVLFYALFYLAIRALELWLFRGGELPQLTWREAVTALVIGLCIYTVSNMSFISEKTLFSAASGRDAYIIRTIADFSGVVLLYAYLFILLEAHLRLEQDTLRQIMEMQYQNYRLSKESVDLVNHKYHDLKHQITLLKDQAQAEQTCRYLDDMEKEIRLYEGRYKTGNDVVDTILTAKGFYCQSHGIELKCMADGSVLSFMTDMEISALLGNMLDNAIECEENIDRQEKRMIRLYIAQEKQFIRIRLENYCEQPITFVDGLPVTTKADKNLHGFGMKSMKKTVEKYDGSLVASQHGNWFELTILLPIAGKSEV